MIKIDITEVDGLIDGPLYVLIAGAAGVGKTTIVGKYVKTIKMMDLDDVIVEVGKGVYSRDNAPEALEIITQRIGIMMEQGVSFIAMGTATNTDSVVERLINACDFGYKTVLIYIQAPLQQILMQNRLRIENGQRGVKLDEEHVIEQMFMGSAYTVSRLKQLDLVDYLVEYDNTRNL